MTEKSAPLYLGCSADHTAFQPTDEQWLCPKCGGDNSDFVIFDNDPKAHTLCGALHNRDAVECTSCGYTGSGRVTAKKLAEKNDLVTCPCCKGKGVVAKTIEKVET